TSPRPRAAPAVAGAERLGCAENVLVISPTSLTRIVPLGVMRRSGQPSSNGRRIPPRRQAKPRQRWPLARQVGSFVPTDVAVPAPLWKSPGLGGDHARTQGGRTTRGRTAAAQPR